MGAQLCMALTGNVDQANKLVSFANATIQEARSTDANEALTINDVTPDWLRVRGVIYSDYWSGGTGYGWDQFGLWPSSDMATPVIQKSFNSGEWAPQLYSRVDLEKYHSGAALLENFFVDYRGGASTRTGTQYILQAWNSVGQVRLIPFRASQSVGYILEFGWHYIRFYYDKAPILEAQINNISHVTNANPAVVSVSNNYVAGDVIYIDGVLGMTQLNGILLKVLSDSSAQVYLADLNGNTIDSTGFGAYTSGGTTQRVYTICTPYGVA